MIKTEDSYQQQQLPSYLNQNPGSRSNLNTKNKFKSEGAPAANAQSVQKQIQNDDELKQLWIACYFERRLSKPVIQAMDLKHTLRVIMTLSNQGSIDFRVVIPLVHGLSKILYRKFNYLLSESNSTLETLSHPFGDLNEEAQQVAAEKARRLQQNKEKRQRDYGGNNLPNYAQGARPKNFIDLSVVKYPGIDKQVMNQISEAFKKDYSETMQAMGMKQEDLQMKDEMMSPFMNNEMRQNHNMSFGLSNIKREHDVDNSDIRNIQPQPGEFERELINTMSFGDGYMPDELRNNFLDVSRNQNQTNINDDVIRLADKFLNNGMGDYDGFPMIQPDDAPFMHDNPFNDDIDNFEMKNEDINFPDYFDETLGDMQTPVKDFDNNAKKMKAKQFIRKEFMKFDKKTQRVKQRQGQDLYDDKDDITNAMSNLILKQSTNNHQLSNQGQVMTNVFNMNNEDSTFMNSNIGVLRTSMKQEMKQENITQRKSLSSTLMTINPHVESFLSFVGDNDKTASFMHKSKFENPDQLFNMNDMENLQQNQNDQFFGDFMNQNDQPNLFEDGFNQNDISAIGGFQSPDKSYLGTSPAPKAQFTDIIPQELHSKDFTSDKNEFESQTFKRSEETFTKLQNLAQRQQHQTLSLEKNIIPELRYQNQALKECAVQTFIDMLFLNQSGKVRLEQNQPQNFSDIQVSLI